MTADEIVSETEPKHSAIGDRIHYAEYLLRDYRGKRIRLTIEVLGAE